MPRIRVLVYHGEEWRLSDLARAHGLLPQTLWRRLASDLPLEHALSAPILTRSQSGRRGYCASHWRDE